MISFHQAAAAAVVVAAADDDGSGLWLPETANLMSTQSQKSSSPQHFSEKSYTQPIHPAQHPPITITKTQSLYFNSLASLVYSNPHSKQQQEQEVTTEETTKEEQEQEQEARTEQEKD
jgi:hypothetical protein